MNVTLEISDKQQQFLSSKKRNALFLGGRGCGKTACLALYALQASQRGKAGRAIVGANNPDQIHQIVVPSIMKLFDRCGLQYTWGSSPPWYDSAFPHHYNILSVETGYQMACRSLFDYDVSVRGLECSDLLIDEIRDLETEAIDVAQACLRGFGENYWVRCFSTPNGKDKVIWKRWIKEPMPDSEVIHATSYDNPFLPKSFAEGLKAQLSEDLWRQEVLGEVLDMNIGRVYHFTDQHISETIPEKPTAIVFSLDFNVQPMGGCLLYWYQDSKQFYQFDEIKVRTDATTPQGCSQALSKIKTSQYPNIPLWYMGDEAGSARSTKGISDIQLMKNSLSGRCLNDGAKPRIIDRINSVNCLLAPAIGPARFHIHPKCKETIEDLESMRWKEDRRETEKADIERSHWSEALGYAIFRLCPIRGKNISGFYQGD